MRRTRFCRRGSFGSKFMYSFLLAIIYLAFISLGLPDSLLGSAWPTMQSYLGIPSSWAGIVTMIISGGTICSSLLSDRLTKKLGTGVVTAVSVALTAAALFGFSLSDRFWMLCLWAVPYGLGAGAVDAALNNYVAVHYSSRQMSWLHCFWGIGTIISPYIMSYALSAAQWRDGYRWVSFIQIGIALLLFCSLPFWKRRASGAGEKAAPLGLKNTLKIRGVPQLLIGFFAYCAAESTIMLWASSYLVSVRSVTEQRAAAFASLFFIGITAGRFLSGLISVKLGDKTLIRAGTVIGAAGILLLLLPVSSEYPALIGLVVIGLGFAPVYPSVIHSTPDHFGADNSQAIIGVQMASAYIGSTFAPLLFGVLADAAGISLMPFWLIAFVGLMISMFEWTERSVARRKRAENCSAGGGEAQPSGTEKTGEESGR